MSVSWYVVLKIQLRYKLHHELLINSRSTVNIPTQRAFLDYSPCPPLNVCEGLSPPIRYLTLLLRMKQPLVGLQRTVDRCYVSLRNNLFPSAVARAVLITCRRGRAANYPGGRKGYFGRSEGPKLVCSLETQARPVALDGMICSDLGGSWHHSCSKKNVSSLLLSLPLPLLFQNILGSQLQKCFVASVCFLLKTSVRKKIEKRRNLGQEPLLFCRSLLWSLLWVFIHLLSSVFSHLCPFWQSCVRCREQEQKEKGKRRKCTDVKSAKNSRRSWQVLILPCMRGNRKPN